MNFSADARKINITKTTLKNERKMKQNEENQGKKESKVK